MTTENAQPQPDEKKGKGKAAVDWERIEADYRAGILSLREIASANGNVTEGAIRKRAKRDDWSRDIANKIKARADDLVRKAEVRSEVRKENAGSEKSVIEANAEAIVSVRLSHRSDIRTGRELVRGMLEELRAQSVDPALLEELGEMMRNPDERGVDKLNDVYKKVIGFGGRVDNVKKLSEALKNLIALEREAYGLAEAQKIELTGKDGGPVTAMTPGDAYMRLLGKANG